MSKNLNLRTIDTVTTPVLQEPDQPHAKPLDAEAYALQITLASLIQLGATTSRRSRQTTIGISQLGGTCDRELSYRENATCPSNLTDPLRALVGTGLHLALAELFRRLDAGAGRFLVETDVAYRGTPGTLDLLDRFSGTLIDWKSTTKAKITQIRYHGPPGSYIIQLQAYAAALVTQGETVRKVALVYLPVDSTLEDIYVWLSTYEQQAADTAIEKLAQMRLKAPHEVQATPSALCAYCAYHNPQSTELDHACPGKDHT
jgi:CRISPR/Cas system-associated exonuclease Cas4 (RecB family)